MTIYSATQNYYENFSDVHDMTQFERDVLKIRFIQRVCDFLETKTKTRMSANNAYAVAASLYARMSDRTLHYHTPVHIMAIFDFARTNYMDLKSWEELAIVFHDAIYEPSAANCMNEHSSALFMQAMLHPYIEEEVIDEVYNAIIATSQHLENEEVDQKFHRLLDLDICNFAMPREDYKKTGILVRKEFEVDEQAWNEGKKDSATSASIPCRTPDATHSLRVAVLLCSSN